MNLRPAVARANEFSILKPAPLAKITFALYIERTRGRDKSLILLLRYRSIFFFTLARGVFFFRWEYMKKLGFAAWTFLINL